MKEVDKRILEEIDRYIAAHCMNYSDLAEKLGITKSTISGVRAGRYNIGTRFKKALHEKCGFTLNFLATGEGPVFESSVSVNNSKVAIGGNASVDSHNTSADPDLIRRLMDRIETLEAEKADLLDKYITLLEKMAR